MRLFLSHGFISFVEMNRGNLFLPTPRAGPMTLLVCLSNCREQKETALQGRTCPSLGPGHERVALLRGYPKSLLFLFILNVSG